MIKIADEIRYPGSKTGVIEEVLGDPRGFEDGPNLASMDRLAAANPDWADFIRAVSMVGTHVCVTGRVMGEKYGMDVRMFEPGAATTGLSVEGQKEKVRTF